MGNKLDKYVLCQDQNSLLESFKQDMADEEKKEKERKKKEKEKKKNNVIEEESLWDLLI